MECRILVRDEIKYKTNTLRVGPFNIKIPIPNRLNTLRYYGVQYPAVRAIDGTLYGSSNQGQLGSYDYPNAFKWRSEYVWRSVYDWNDI